MNHNICLWVIVVLAVTFGGVARAQSNPLKIGKTGYFTLQAETRVGDAVLPPGDYEVRCRRSATGHFVEFTRIRRHDTSYRETVAKVPCTELLGGAVKKTTLELASDGIPRLISLRIRGENVVHAFPAGQQTSPSQSSK